MRSRYGFKQRGAELLLWAPWRTALLATSVHRPTCSALTYRTRRAGNGPECFGASACGSEAQDVARAVRRLAPGRERGARRAARAPSAPGRAGCHTMPATAVAAESPSTTPPRVAWLVPEVELLVDCFGVLVQWTGRPLAVVCGHRSTAWSAVETADHDDRCPPRRRRRLHPRGSRARPKGFLSLGSGAAAGGGFCAAAEAVRALPAHWCARRQRSGESGFRLRRSQFWMRF